MKVMTVVGTRPELIRLSCIIPMLDSTFSHVLVHTGQNWDPQLSDVFFRDLAIRSPDHWLHVPVSSLGATLGGVLSGVEAVLVEEAPDALLVLGDTNSSFAAVMAKRMGIPVFHMEAGNRSFDENVPEEINRRIIDHCSDFNLCYTEHARRNLLAEGLPSRRTFVVGSPMAEVLSANREKIARSTVLDRLGLHPDDYYLVSMHREENVDNPDRLELLIGEIGKLGSDTGRRIIFSTHPRLRNRLGDALGQHDGALEYREPFGFLDYQKLQSNARCVLSDSGTVSEEASIAGFRAVTIRDSMERPEALETGSIVLTGVGYHAIRRAVDLVCAQWDSGARPVLPVEYQVADVSSRVTRLISGLTAVHGTWLGLRNMSRHV